jgi:hypothetical protein
VNAAAELQIPLNHLTTTLNRSNGRPYKVWRTSTFASGRNFQHLSDVEALKLFGVKVIEFIWVHQAKIFMSPCRISHIWGDRIHSILKLRIIFIRSIGRSEDISFAAMARLAKGGKLYG